MNTNPAPESQVNRRPAAKPRLPRASRGASPKLLGAAAISLLLLAHATGASAQALGAPPLVIRSNTQESTIWAQDRVGAPAPNGSQTMQSTTGAGAATGTVNATGANTVLSTTQVVQPSSILIQGDLPCEPTTKTWTVAAQSCEATLPRTFSGFTASGTDSTQPTTGQAEFACSSGCKPNRRPRWWILGTKRHKGRTCLLSDHRRLRQQCLGQLDRRPRAGGWIARQQHPRGSKPLDDPLALGPAANPQLRNLLRRLLEQGSGAARLRPPAARLSPSLHGRC